MPILVRVQTTICLLDHHILVFGDYWRSTKLLYSYRSWSDADDTENKNLEMLKWKV